MSARYEVGELVDIAIRNARIVEADGTGVMVSAADMDAMWLDLSAVTVTRVAPKEWPPQPGDVWLDADDNEWFGHGELGSKTAGLLAANGRVGGAADGALSNYGPLRLAYRRGWSPKPEPAGPPAAEPKPDVRAERIAGLRGLADWLEETPDVPLSYIGDVLLHVGNLPHMVGKADDVVLAELVRIADLMGVTADLRDEQGAPHPHATKAFRGGVEFKAVHVTDAYRRGYKDIPGAGEEVAGPGAESATAPAESSPAGPAAPADDPPAGAVSGDSRLQDRPGPATVPDHVNTWVARRRRGIAYHGFHGLGTDGQYTACGRAARANGYRLTRAEAEAFGAVPCDRCYGGAA